MLLMFAAGGAFAQNNGIAVAPGPLTIQYQLGSATLPAAQTLTAKTTPAALDITVAVSGAPYNAAWLLVSVVAGPKAQLSLKVEAIPLDSPLEFIPGRSPLPPSPVPRPLRRAQS